MGFFKRQIEGAVDKKRKQPGKLSGKNYKRVKFEKKGKSPNTKKKKEIDEEIPSSSDENEILDDVSDGLEKTAEEENVSEDEYEDSQTLAHREAKRLLANVKKSSDFDETIAETDGILEREESKIANVHRKVADHIHFDRTPIIYRPHRLTPIGVCFSSKSEFLISWSKDGSLIKYDLKQHRRVGMLKRMPKNLGKDKNKEMFRQKFKNSHTGLILCCAVSPNDKYLVTGGSDHLIKIWDFATLDFVRDFDGHRGPITSLRFRQCEAMEMFSSSTDRSIMVWNMDELGLMNTLYGHQDAIEQLDILQWPRLVSCGGMDKSCRLFKVLDDSHLVFNGFADCVSIDCVALIDEEHFISGCVDGSLYIWSIARKKPVGVLKRAHGCHGTKQDRPNQNVADLTTEPQQRGGPAERGEGEPRWIITVAALPYTDLVASGSSDGFVRLWRVAPNWKSVNQIDQFYLPGFINDIRFSPDGQQLACAIGQEHRRGRWWTIKEDDNGQRVQNRIVVISLKGKEAAATVDGANAVNVVASAEVAHFNGGEEEAMGAAV